MAFDHRTGNCFVTSCVKNIYFSKSDVGGFWKTMTDTVVPYMPVSKFDVSEVVKGLSDLEKEEPDHILDIKSLKSHDFPEEMVLILLGMGMEKYMELFKRLNIGLDSFFNINESELEEIGITDANDRKIIFENLKSYRKNLDDLIVKENHAEDFTIIKNVYHQLLLLQNYCAYVELQMRKEALTDYTVDTEDSACTFLRAYIECALTQSQIMSKKIFDVNSSEGLIDKLLKINNLTLPEPLRNCLPEKRKKYFFKFMVVISFSSLVVLTVRYLVKKS